MLEIPGNFEGSRILITNDDGVGSEGIEVLKRVAGKLSDDIWVVAPEKQQSGASHSLTLHDPILYKQIDERTYSVTGTPTDSVILAVHEIIPKDKPVSLVLSGVNHGMNIADDVTYSGTIAAAMEGTLLKIPSIAFSQAMQKDTPINWQRCEEALNMVMNSLKGFMLPLYHLLSVNVPHEGAGEIKGIVPALQGKRRISDNLIRREDPKGRKYVWVGRVSLKDEEGEEGSDISLLKKGNITITPLKLDMTAHGIMSDMADHMESQMELV